jgi:hypothetical protein
VRRLNQAVINNARKKRRPVKQPEKLQLINSAKVIPNYHEGGFPGRVWSGSQKTLNLVMRSSLQSCIVCRGYDNDKQAHITPTQ